MREEENIKMEKGLTSGDAGVKLILLNLNWAGGIHGQLFGPL